MSGELAGAKGASGERKCGDQQTGHRDGSRQVHSRTPLFRQPHDWLIEWCRGTSMSSVPHRRSIDGSPVDRVEVPVRVYQSIGSCYRHAVDRRHARTWSRTSAGAPFRPVERPPGLSIDGNFR